jgi:hypothetical protein
VGNSSGTCEATADLISATTARDWRCKAKRPRRMGLCSEVADDGENPEDHPALASSYVRRKAVVSACQFLRQIRLGRVEPFSFPLRQSSCLGHCITRGIGLRRQAKIFRLRGAALLRVRKQAAGEFGRIRGVENLQREQFCRPRCAASARESIAS